MAIETGTRIEDLVASNPVGSTDKKKFGDDHIRLIKACLLGSFPSLGPDAVTASGLDLSALDGVAGTFMDTFLQAADVGAAQAALQLAGGVPSGTVVDFASLTIPSGWLPCSGATIGAPASGATYEGAEYETLFDLLKASWGNEGTEDFSLGNTVILPDFRGRVLAGKDDMGGSAASRLTIGSKSGMNGLSLAAVGGVQEHTLVEAETPAHDHTVTGNTDSDGAHTHAISTAYNDDGSVGTPVSSAKGWSNDATETPNASKTTTSEGAHTHNVNLTVGASGGGDEAHTNVQPTAIVLKIIKY